ncbi:hypothetical protein LTR84_006850 [Exophiala bonariae]|uniref:SLC26A/SulP transporter domain-containing protein n=1 Tax=Exophiala bonariae TaxID=1690606 RepID=A0AAV9N041_9EURO|nr:hypothetical protein LTR84_006850 [Exophiala bonariae]
MRELAKEAMCPLEKQVFQNDQHVEPIQNEHDSGTHTFVENEPTVLQTLKELTPTLASTYRYLRALFPCIGWIPRYNFQWLLGDCIAGITVALVVVPQAMAYALLATLSPEFGLYTSFAGAATYWLFGTSKDIVIGVDISLNPVTTAVGSLLVGEVINRVHEVRPNEYTSAEIAKNLSFITGVILLFLGLVRLGWVVEAIPYIPVSAFITAASITIMCTQFPVMMGIPGINSREVPYQVVIKTLRKLGETQLDAVIGLTCLIQLDLIRRLCSKMEARQPKLKRLWSTISSLRLTFAMLLYTLISWLVNRDLSEKESRFRLVGLIEKGFVHAGPPSMSLDLLGIVLPQSPIVIIVLVIEHIAIAKSFGKQFGYRVVPSQEIMAQGTANMLGPFLGGYSCTGSFGASAVLSKAAVRTPIAGLFSALLLLLALYALTGVFYFIPRAALAGLIIHAVLNLVASPTTVMNYWRLSPFECMIWIIGVITAMFTGLETSIYVTIGLSLLILLVRLSRTKGQILGHVSAYSTRLETPSHDCIKGESLVTCPPWRQDLYLPLDKKDGSNPAIPISTISPGIFVYHFPEGLNYLNQALHFKALTEFVYGHTSRTTASSNVSKQDMLWCDDSSSNGQDVNLPKLKAVIIDCSTINSIDITSVQGMCDTRNSLDRWASPTAVNWHFGGLRNRWSRRALWTAGFGRLSEQDLNSLGNWTPMCSLTTGFGGATEADISSERIRRKQRVDEKDESGGPPRDIVPVKTEIDQISRIQMKGPGDRGTRNDLSRELRDCQPIFAIDRPLFHATLDEAVAAAVSILRSRT